MISKGTLRAGIKLIHPNDDDNDREMSPAQVSPRGPRVLIITQRVTPF